MPAQCVYPVYSLGVVAPGDTIVKQFTLFNKGDEQLTIQELVPSCYCISAAATSETVDPGCESVVSVSIIVDTVPGQFSRHIDVFYKEKDNSERLTLHGFIINKP